jgi:BTB/POZ domain
MSDQTQEPGPQTPIINVASPPFDDLTGNVVLRTSDNVDFYLHKVILSLASPVLKDMFGLPQPSTLLQDGQEGQRETPVISISEDSRTLDNMMRFCYPCDEPALENLNDVQRVIQAMEKYDMTEAGKRVRRMLVKPVFLEKEPLRVFIIAYCSKMEDEARLAARSILRFPIKGQYAEELQDIPASVYYHLLDYHDRCGQAASGLFPNLTWVQKQNWVWFGCSQCPANYYGALLADGVETRASNWFKEYIERAAKALKARPHPTVVSCPELMEFAFKEIATCRSRGGACGYSGFAQLLSFSKSVFEKEVERVTSEVN